MIHRHDFLDISFNLKLLELCLFRIPLWHCYGIKYGQNKAESREQRLQWPLYLLFYGRIIVYVSDMVLTRSTYFET